MPYKKIAALVLILMMLTGCGKQEPTQRAVDMRTALLAAQGCSFTAHIRADYGEKVFDFSLDADYSPEKTVLTVTAPKEIAGISAVTDKDGTSLRFDGAELAMGKLANGLISPILVPWILGQCWTGEYISCAGKDAELYRVTYLKGYDEEELQVDTWLDGEDIPVYAEIFYGDVLCITAQIENFQM